ncbi:hypothetical protein AB0L53_42125 [Nonomuraea sp. NPDC052129]|uniref:hypothetical protein n=1 Tax=Nonomuraea sp. NPDC052129 TaxID=3154651 RepID=UPI00341E6F75
MPGPCRAPVQPFIERPSCLTQPTCTTCWSPSISTARNTPASSAIQLARCLRDLPYAEAFTAYEAERRPRVDRVIKETTRKNASKAAGPVGRIINAYAIRIFGKLGNPEKMTWIFDYRTDWDTKATG